MSTEVAAPTTAGHNSSMLPTDGEGELQPDIETLVARSQAGCIRSFEGIVTRFHQKIFHYLYQLTGNRQDAEDLTQITFLKAFRNLSRYRSQHAFSAWLFTIAKRSALNHFRDRRPSEELSDDQVVETENPSHILERADDRGDLWHLARTLKPAQYEALWLRYGEGLSVAEAARVMNTNSLRVRVLLHRARTALGQKLSRTGYPLRQPNREARTTEEEAL